MTWHGFAGMSIDCKGCNYNYKLVSKVVPTFVDINIFVVIATSF